MWNLEIWCRWTYLQSRNGDTDVEKKYGPQGGNRGWDELEDWNWQIYYWYYVWNRKLMRICGIAQGTLLSALWGPKWERNSRKRNICVCMAGSLCSTAETNTTYCNTTLFQQKSNFLNGYGLQNSEYLVQLPENTLTVDALFLFMLEA